VAARGAATRSPYRQPRETVGDGGGTKSACQLGQVAGPNPYAAGADALACHGSQLEIHEHPNVTVCTERCGSALRVASVPSVPTIVRNARTARAHLRAGSDPS